jgi:hypothetical protein
LKAARTRIVTLPTSRDRGTEETRIQRFHSVIDLASGTMDWASLLYDCDREVTPEHSGNR